MWLAAYQEQIRALVKELPEALMKEEREIYLENHPMKANGYYARDLLTLAGPLEDLKVPRVREGHFHPKILPYRKRTSLDFSEAIFALYAVGVSTRKISAFWRGFTAPFTRPRVSPVCSRLPKNK